MGARTLSGTLQCLGTDVAELLEATGDPLRDRRLERDIARTDATAERERATSLLTSVDVPSTLLRHG